MAPAAAEQEAALLRAQLSILRRTWEEGVKERAAEREAWEGERVERDRDRGEENARHRLWEREQGEREGLEMRMTDLFSQVKALSSEVERERARSQAMDRACKEEHDAWLMLKGGNESLERAVKLEKRERAVAEEDGRKRVQQVRFSSLAYT